MCDAAKPSYNTLKGTGGKVLWSKAAKCVLEGGKLKIKNFVFFLEVVNLQKNDNILV